MPSETNTISRYFYQVIDTILDEMNNRFTTTENVIIYLGLNALQPKSDAFLAFIPLKAFANHYCLDDAELLRNELAIFQGVLARNSPTMNNMMDLAVFLLRYKDCFCVILECVKIALAIPATSAGCERSFSVLRQIKTYLRTTMGDERLADLGVLGIHRQRAKSLELEEVLDKFLELNPDRRSNFMI